MQQNATKTLPPEETRDVVLRLLKRGVGVRDIAASLGISTQAVYKHKARLRAAGELPKR